MWPLAAANRSPTVQATERGLLRNGSATRAPQRRVRRRRTIHPGATRIIAPSGSGPGHTWQSIGARARRAPALATSTWSPSLSLGAHMPKRAKSFKYNHIRVGYATLDRMALLNAAHSTPWQRAVRAAGGTHASQSGKVYDDECFHVRTVSHGHPRSFTISHPYKRYTPSTF